MSTLIILYFKSKIQKIRRTYMYMYKYGMLCVCVFLKMYMISLSGTNLIFILECGDIFYISVFCLMETKYTCTK